MVRIYKLQHFLVLHFKNISLGYFYRTNLIMLREYTLKSLFFA